ncbi:MAG: lysylphosphatidylglycerol synthase transmembrane domain-containing protein [Gemmatimonadaceae bacterium]
MTLFDARWAPAPTLHRSRLRAWIRVVVGAALIAFIVSRVDLSAAAPKSWWRAAWGVAIASALLVLAQYLSALRWRAVLRTDAPQPRFLFRLYLAGQFFGLFLPTSVGGDALRIMWLARATGRHAIAVASVLVDRLLGLAALGCYLALGVVFAGSAAFSTLGLRRNVGMRTVALLGVVGVLVLVVTFGWWRSRGAQQSRPNRATFLWRIEEATQLLRRPMRAWIPAAALAMGVQTCYLATWYALTRSLQLPVPIPFLMLAVPAVSVAAMLPVTISGLGVREGAWIALLAPLGVAAAEALTCSLLYFAAFTVVGAIGGLWFSVAGVAPTTNESPSTRTAPSSAQEVA